MIFFVFRFTKDEKVIIPEKKDDDVMQVYSSEEQAIAALKNKDPSYCEGISKDRVDVCLSDYYMLVALKDVDKNKCEKIPLEDISKSCVASIEKDVDKCSSVGGEWKNICVQFVNNDAVSAVREKNFDLCDGIQGISPSYCKSLLKAVS